eukprot:220377-Rhodomonas_salina.2
MSLTHVVGTVTSCANCFASSRFWMDAEARPIVEIFESVCVLRTVAVLKESGMAAQKKSLVFFV